jgi:TolB-like protein/Flp pilus assembly protein TadD
MDPRQVRAELDRILHSPGFAHSERMTRFLQCVVERKLAGRADELKEYLLGVEVFDRKPDYDPRVDPIVRVEARRLRSKLEDYYENHGADSEIVIELPKGGYIPTMRPSGPAPPVPSAPVERHRSVAVLPITSNSRDAEHEYLCEGITQEIIHALTKATGLRVVAWQSAARFSSKDQDASSVGRQLGVSYVLRGTLRVSGGRLRVLAQLIDTANAEYIWSESYDRQIADVFDIEQDISAAIVRALQTQIGVCRRPTANHEVYGLYLKGRYHWNKRTEDGLRCAVEHFQQAIELEPDFALGHAGLADAYILLADYAADSPSSVIGCARSSATRALSIDPTLGEAESSLALITSLHDWDWDLAGSHYRRAMELNPSYATAYFWYGLDYCALLGRFPEALQAAETAIQLDPLSSILRESIAYIHLLSRQYQAAEAEYRNLIAFDPVFYKAWTGLSRALFFQGRYDEAIEALLKGRALSGGLPNQLAALGQTYACAGDLEKAREMLLELNEMTEHHFVPQTCFAVIHVGLGEKDLALEHLKGAYGQRELPLATIGVHPLWDSLRTHRDFKELLGKIGLHALA